jgi:hypothetical protein
MPPRSGGVRSIGWSGEHSRGPQYVEAGCIPVARARGKGSGTAKNPVALGVGNDRSELARESPALAQRGVPTPPGRDHWAPAQVSRLWPSRPKQLRLPEAARLRLPKMRPADGQACTHNKTQPLRAGPPVPPACQRAKGQSSVTRRVGLRRPRPTLGAVARNTCKARLSIGNHS